ncbi:hypothetical protein GOP47_0021510 [Adiantum capillus-veneris]|uniref:Protein kinase domain-containing protein n=1 Tax=Adiantum capillus-veneris TaxID=13818 RepID=A0A9D4Z5B4_ADICA|nr:hypothetical protein GOP47_0021510 [Adiantum capillus-veneris]
MAPLGRPKKNKKQRTIQEVLGLHDPQLSLDKEAGEAATTALGNTEAEGSSSKKKYAQRWIESWRIPHPWAFPTVDHDGKARVKCRWCIFAHKKTQFSGEGSSTLQRFSLDEHATSEFLDKMKLPLHKMIGIATDGASVMIGANNGVVSRLKKVVPHLLSFHCVAHRESLAADVLGELNVLSCKLQEDHIDISAIGNHLKASIKSLQMAFLGNVFGCEAMYTQLFLTKVINQHGIIDYIDSSGNSHSHQLHLGFMCDEDVLDPHETLHGVVNNLAYMAIMYIKGLVDSLSNRFKVDFDLFEAAKYFSPKDYDQDLQKLDFFTIRWLDVLCKQFGKGANSFINEEECKGECISFITRIRNCFKGDNQGSSDERVSETYEVGGADVLWASPVEKQLPSSFYQDWANARTFFINDSLYFSYNSSIHDVTFVGIKEELVGCVFSNITAQEGTGSSYWTFYIASTYYIMSSRRAINGTNISRDCEEGMKFELVVHDLSSAPLHPPQLAPAPLATSSPTRVVTPSYPPLLAPAPLASTAPSSVNGATQVLIRVPWQRQPNIPDFYKTYIQDELKKRNISILPAGSALSFRFAVDKHNVIGVLSEDYDICHIPTMPNSVHRSSDVPINLPDEGKYYFIDGLNDNCASGNMRLFVQVGPSDAISGRTRAKRFPITAVVVPSAVITVGMILGLLCFCIQKARAQGQYTTVNAKDSVMGNLLAASGGRNTCKVFTLEELQRATDNFSADNEIGSGGFGMVYKGILHNGVIVAIKKMKHAGGDDAHQFVNEISILSQVNHRYLVKLFGYGVVFEDPFLVYEYISNGNLEEHIAKAQQGISMELTWKRRFNIAVQTADALKYLHVQASPPIFHRDVKSANILLDKDFSAKVADFGLSKLVDIDATHVSTMVKGTPGYLDPDYFQNFVLTDKSDVYSFGVVLLELLTSRKPIDTSRPLSEQNIASSSIPLNLVGRTREILDWQLMEQASGDDLLEMDGVAQVAASCLIHDRTVRPSMSEGVEMLQRIKGLKQAEQFLSKVSNRVGLATQTSAMLSTSSLHNLDNESMNTMH